MVEEQSTKGLAPVNPEFSGGGLDVRVFAEMGATQAKAMTDMAKFQFAVPARQATYRTYGPLVLVAVLLYFLVPPFLNTHPDKTTLAYVIVAIVAIAGAPAAVKAIADALKGNS